MGRNILIIVEHKEGHVKNVSKEILSFCNAAGSKNGFYINAFVYGESLTKQIYDEIARCGVKKIFSVKGKDLINDNPELIKPTIIDVIKSIKPEIVVFGNTACGKDLSPWLAQYFSSHMISDGININFDNDNIIVTKPIYGGRILQNIKLLNKKMTFITIRPNVLGMREVQYVKSYITDIYLIKVDKPAYIIRDVLKKTEMQLPVNEAEIIVAGGRAFKNKGDFKILEQLGETLGATVGASRPVVDSGIKRRSFQIGQSGKSVSPRIIFCCGISGQIQFVAGIANARTVISINKNSDATIFKASDYGIVGDVFKIVPLLTKRLYELLVK